MPGISYGGDAIRGRLDKIRRVLDSLYQFGGVENKNTARRAMAVACSTMIFDIYEA